jgi:hypothetical protein
VGFLIFLVTLSVEGAHMLQISFKPRTSSCASFGSFSTSGDPEPACAVFILGFCTVCCSDTLGGDASLFGSVVLCLANISVNSFQAIRVFVGIFY